MAFFQMHYHSDALKRAVALTVVIPENAKTLIGMSADAPQTYKTVFLLHGLSDDDTIWERRTSIERYAADRKIAVVMPSVGRSWYTDTASGNAYFTFVAKELPSVCRGFFRGMSDKREDTFVAGLSMGGYGAAKIALSCPETFGGFASLSGALAPWKYASLIPEPEWKGIFGFDCDNREDFLGSQNDVFHLADVYAKKGYPFPKAFLWCGTEDGLLADNRDFRAHLEKLGYPFTYRESEGNHSWKWWDLHIQEALDFLLATN